MREAGASIANRAVALLVLIVAAFFLMKFVIGVVTGIATVVAVLVAIVAVFWAVNRL